MTEYPIHQRVFKVSKVMNQLDLQCGQHKRQSGHCQGLPDWDTPRTPAGKATSSHHVRTPAFFAWENQERPQSTTWQTETPQKVARMLEMESGEPDVEPERSPHTHLSKDGLDAVGGEEQEEDRAIEVEDREARWMEEDQPVGTGRCIAVSPIREDILDRVHPAAAIAVPPQNPAHLSVAEVSPSPYRPSPSPRYRHGRQLEENEAALLSSRTAGVTTEQADRYRMSRSSGKRLRSPAKRTMLWGDVGDSYIHQSGASTDTDTPSVSHKRQLRSAAERTFGGSSVFQTLNMNNCNWPRSDVMRGERRHVVTGPDAMNAADEAGREFLEERDEESKPAEPLLQQVHARHYSVDNDSFGSVFGASTTGPATGPKNYRKTKRVSFGGNALVNHPNEVAVYAQPRTLPVLADKTTQTEASLWSTRTQTSADRLDVSDRREAQGNDMRWDTTMDEFGLPRKIRRGSTNSVGAALAQHLSYRRTSGHLTNPIMTNPRYPPETTKVQGMSAYSKVLNDRLPWR